MDAKRDDRIDWLKGVGIVAVAAGHIYAGSTFAPPLLYLWHMPLFFLLSGLVFKPSPNYVSFTTGKVRSLLIPYFTYLAVLSVLMFAETGERPWLSMILFGGQRLRGWFAVFWFVTCLFVTQQIANVLIQNASVKWVWAVGTLSAATAFAVAVLLPGWSVPWNVNICLLALPLFLLGYGFRFRVGPLHAGIAAVLGVLGIVACAMNFLGTPDLKAQNYGTPVLSLVAGVAICIALFKLAHYAVQIPALRVVGVELGQASLTIMFLHQAIQYTAQWLGIGDPTVRLVIALVIALLLHHVFKRARATRIMLLGEKR